MTTLVLRFPTGRYHATPWGHHVNEGLVEWPPSPWRLLRALIAVGYRTLGWGPEVPDSARELIATLAGSPPTYRLPRAGLGHSRHYMPIGVLDKGREKTNLVLDAFACPGDAPLSVTWPVELSPDARALLSRLAERLSYLGRAESWVDAHLLAPGSPLPEGDACEPCAGSAEVLEPGWEQISVLAPLSSEAYRAWRAACIEELLARPELRSRGTRKPSKALLRKRARATAPYPEDLWACLCAGTSELQRQGWSRPPGSRRLPYRRRIEALEIARLPAVPLPADDRVEAMLLAISLPGGNKHALPPLARTLPQAELLHRSAVSHATRPESPGFAPEIIGRDADRRPLRGHRHAHTLPLDLDGDGHLDHILVWAAGGLGRAARTALRRVRRTWTKKGADDLRVAVAASGSLASMAGLPPPHGPRIRALAGPASRWRSATPFVPPRHPKRRGRNTLEEQIQAELEARGLPRALRIDRLGRQELLALRFRHFVLARSRGGPRPPVTAWFGFELRFAEPIPGPLCLGYGSHFGLGRFDALGAPAPDARGGDRDEAEQFG